MDSVNDVSLVSDAVKRQWMRTIEGEGGTCPCCGKWGKVYTIRLAQHLALSLRWIMVHGEDEGWVSVQKRGPRWMLRSKTYPLLAHWGLVESKGKRSGMWRATAYGRDFVGGYAIVPEAVHVYDNTLWGESKRYVAYRSCFSKHFDFDALMSDRFNWREASDARPS